MDSKLVPLLSEIDLGFDGQDFARLYRANVGHFHLSLWSQRRIEPTLILNELKTRIPKDDQFQLSWRPRIRHPPCANRFSEELKDQI